MYEYTAISGSLPGETNSVYCSIQRSKFKNISFVIVGWACATAIVVLSVSHFSAPSGPRKMHTSDAPSQIHIAQGDVEGNTIVVSWRTNTNQPGAVVIQAQGIPTRIVNATLPPVQYVFDYYYQAGSYVSGFFHHVLVPDLELFVTYSYRCGSDGGGFSQEHEFVALGSSLEDAQRVLGENYVSTLVMIGDLGQTDWSRQTVQRAMESTWPHSHGIIVGDLSYADSAAVPNRGPLWPDSQARWDTWGEMVEPYASTRALMVLPGNHEIEYNPEVKSQVPFMAYQSR